MSSSECRNDKAFVIKECRATCGSLFAMLHFPSTSTITLSSSVLVESDSHSLPGTIHSELTNQSTMRKLRHRDDRGGNIWQNLPTSVLSLVLEHLSLADGRSLMQSCSILWFERKELESQRRCLRFPAYSLDERNACCSRSSNLERNMSYFLYPPINENLTNLLVLDFGPYITNTILLAMRFHLPNLQELYMIGSNPALLTDQGFLSLGLQDRARCQNLRYVDITGCDSISYYATILLRKRLRHPDLIIRRQPAWMDGHFQTPYAHDGIHTYYADGSFLYDRTELNCGYVCDLWQWPNSATNDAATTMHNPVALDQESYGNSLYFINFKKPEHWPLWTIDFMYPGVSLLPYRYDKVAKDGSRTVLVVQCLRGLLPPEVRADNPNYQRKELPIGISQFYDIHEKPLLSSEQGVVPQHAHQRVTRMRVFPLEDRRFSPKPNIQDLNLKLGPQAKQRNCYMPPDDMVNVIELSITTHMARNANSRVVSFQSEWVLSKKAIRQSAQYVHQIFMGAAQAEDSKYHEITERYVNLIYRQRSSMLSSFNGLESE
jgi:hypothetical protein